MFVSIIVPVYNAQATLDRCIRSVQNQAETDWELILTDDGSTDNSAKLCAEYAAQDPRIRLIQIPNHGVSYARNLGIDQAAGEYVYFLDADDYLANDALAVLKEKVSQDPADVVFTAFYKEYKSKTELVSVYQNGTEPDPYHTRLLGTVWGKLYRRQFIGNARFDRQLHLCEDAEFNYRILPSAQRFVFCEAPTYHYVYYGSSAVRGYQPQRVSQYEQALTRIHEHCRKDEPKMCRSVTAFTCNVFSVIVMNNLFHIGNKSTLKQKFQTLWELCARPLFQTAMNEVAAGSISRQQLLLIRMCRAHFAPGIWLLSQLNRIRNRLLNY